MTRETPAPDAPRRRARPWRTLMMAGFLAVIAFMPFALVFLRPVVEDTPGLDLGKLEIEDLQGGLRMIAPSFSGRTENGEPFTVTADWALPNSPKPSRISLNHVKASLQMRDGREAVLTSEKGIYFPKRQRMKLTQGVVGETSDGYTIRTEAALVDVAERRLETESKVTATGPRGFIRADTLEALDAGGRIVIFRGNVRVRFVPEATEADNPSFESEPTDRMD